MKFNKKLKNFDDHLYFLSEVFSKVNWSVELVKRVRMIY